MSSLPVSTFFAFVPALVAVWAVTLLRYFLTGTFGFIEADRTFFRYGPSAFDLLTQTGILSNLIKNLLCHATFGHAVFFAAAPWLNPYTPLEERIQPIIISN